MIILVAKNASSAEARLAAISRISDVKILSDLFHAEKEWNLCKAIAQRAGVPSLASEVRSIDALRIRALVDPRWRARLDAVEALRPGRDDDALTRIAINDKYKDVRIAAIEKIESEKYRIDVAEHFIDHVKERLRWTSYPDDDNSLVFLGAIEGIHSTIYSEKLFDDLALRKWHALTSLLCQRLDQSILAKTALKSNDLFLVKQCVENLKDQEAISKVARGKFAALDQDNRDNCRVRERAIEKLTNVAVLSDIAKFDDNPWIQKTAKSRISQLGVNGLSANPSPENVMRAARGAFGEEGQLAVLRMDGVSKEAYSTAFKGFLSRAGGGWSSDYNLDNELIKKCPYNDLVQWVSTNIRAIVHHDRGYWDEVNAKEELVRRGLYSQEQLDDENFKHDAVKQLFFAP